MPTTSLAGVALRWTPDGHRNANYIPTQGCPQMDTWRPQECQLHPYPGLPSDGHLMATGMPTTSLAGVALRWTPGGHRNANYIPTQGCPQMDTWWPQECQLHPYPGLPSYGHLAATGMPTTSLPRVALRWTPDGHRNANYIPSRGCPQMDTWWPQECQLHPYPGLPSDGHLIGHRNANYIPTQGCPQMDTWRPQECQLHP